MAGSGEKEKDKMRWRENEEEGRRGRHCTRNVQAMKKKKNKERRGEVA